jgi:ADP-dependent NAD(P)H-hydrate dehydratase / NAD(P)H-hydrate epimerase
MLYCARSIQKIEKAAIASGVTGFEMMQKAGAIVFAELQNHWPDAKAVSVFCGTGNNGGDGFVVATLASLAGLEVSVYCIGAVSTLKDEAKSAFNALKETNAKLMDFDQSLVIDADVVVDALCGIGLKGAPRKVFLDVFDVINDADIGVLAVDIPSGLNADSGYVAEEAVIADVTVTFIAEKPGLFTGDGPDFAGSVMMHDLDLSDEVLSAADPDVDVFSAQELNEILPPRIKNIHKGQVGHVLVIGGHAGMSGAPVLSALGALRVGAGLVSLGTHPDHASLVNINQPEMMSHAIADEKALIPLLEKASVLVLGPGLGRTPWSEALFQTALAADLPTVIDADGLFWLEQSDKDPQDNWVLTPHAKEAAHLLRGNLDDVLVNRFKTLDQLHTHYGGVAVLKGCGSLIGSEEIPVLCPYGNPGMASGGMGDLLAGIIAGLIAQGIEIDLAAILGVYWHAMAADMAVETVSEHGLIATDLLPEIQRLLRFAESGYS